MDMRQGFLQSRWTHLASSCFMMSLALSACKTSSFKGDSDKAEALPPAQVRSFNQGTLTENKVQFTQGKKGTPSNESYKVDAKGILDLLIVVDNSPSMADEQANLANRLTPLLSAVKDSDWKIAVATTDPADGCLEGVVTKTSLLRETRFRALVRAGISGTGIERPIYQAVEGLKDNCRLFSSKWMRAKSTLAVLFLTDEDNCFVTTEQGYGCTNQKDREAKYLLNYLASIRKVGTEAKVYGIYWDPSQATCPGAYKKADILSTLVTQTGGTWGSICDKDYSPTLQKISQDVAKILKADFALKSVPDAGTLKLTVNGANWTDFTLDGVNVIFTKSPPANAAIAVAYTSGGAGLVTNEFELPTEPKPESLTATVTGAAAPVSWDATKRRAVFSSLPPEGSTIEFTYKELKNLRDTFEIEPNGRPESVSAKINGQPVVAGGISYDSATGTVKFTQAPPEAATIEISWRRQK
jgi:hypothetical protein